MTDLPRNQRLLLMLGCALLAYLTTYILWSQSQIQMAKNMGMPGFYYVMPEEGHSWKFNAHVTVRILFFPCDMVRVGVFGGMSPAHSEPIFTLGDKAQ